MTRPYTSQNAYLDMLDLLIWDLAADVYSSLYFYMLSKWHGMVCYGLIRPVVSNIKSIYGYALLEIENSIHLLFIRHNKHTKTSSWNY